jgi:hypothetical protein
MGTPRIPRPEGRGIESIPKAEEVCRHPQHEPPGMMVIPPGKQFHHVCPGCGYEATIRGSQATMSARA